MLKLERIYRQQNQKLKDETGGLSIEVHSNDDTLSFRGKNSTNAAG